MFGRMITTLGVIFTLVACSEESPLQAVSGRPVRGFFPVELGDLSSRAAVKVQCAGRRTTWKGDELLEVSCPDFAIPVFPDQKGELFVRFSQGRAYELRWEQRALTPDVDRVIRLDSLLRDHFQEPVVSNFDSTEAPLAALTRGEWHRRWSLGNGILFSWFARVDAYSLGQTRTPGPSLYAWVIMARHHPFE